MELFRIGFISLTLIDCLDIALVAFIIYRLYVVLRGTVAVQIFIGLMVIIALSFISRAGNLKAMGWILQTLTDIWVVGFIILFQPEIRRVLSQVARNRFVRMFLRLNVNESIEEISSAAAELSKKRQGALIVVSRGAGMKSFVESGIRLNAHIGRSLLLAIFNPRAPLHDGAVIVNGQIIEAARCTLPLSATTRIGDIVLGMRHRAGLGMSEQTDAVTVIVSEETGAISLAENGTLFRNLTPQELRKELRERLVLSMQRSITNVKEALRAETAL